MRLYVAIAVLRMSCNVIIVPKWPYWNLWSTPCSSFTSSSVTSVKPVMRQAWCYMYIVGSYVPLDNYWIFSGLGLNQRRYDEKYFGEQTGLILAFFVRDHMSWLLPHTYWLLYFGIWYLWDRYNLLQGTRGHSSVCLRLAPPSPYNTCTVYRFICIIVT